MAYEPSFERTDIIEALCMEIAELVGMLSPQAPLSTRHTMRRELRIRTIYSSLVHLPLRVRVLPPLFRWEWPDGKALAHAAVVAVAPGAGLGAHRVRDQEAAG